MPDRRRHRGPHPGDAERFAHDRLPDLRLACTHLGWLAGAGYAPKASLQLVGDRFAFDRRQRQAVARASCSPLRARERAGRERPLAACAELWLDGFNVLTTVEAALAGGVVLVCADGCYRDLASVHGTWHRVDETLTAATRIGEVLDAASVRQVVFWLDAPVGNSGRLAALLRELAAARRWPWRVEVVASPDRVLAQDAVPIATADSAVLDHDVRWVNLARQVVATVPAAWLVHVDKA